MTSEPRRLRFGHSSTLWFWLATLGLFALTILALRMEGRRWWCSCGRLFPWSGDVHSRHNSQHLADPYTFTHVLHGIALCGLFWLVARRVSLRWRFWLATLVECLWEIVENSGPVIERYRAATIAIGYQGDSVANSLGDILACAAGFVLASRIGWRASVVVFIATELVLLVWIRDDLLLNIIMLVYPSETIKAWQMGN